MKVLLASPERRGVSRCTFTEENLALISRHNSTAAAIHLFAIAMVLSAHGVFAQSTAVTRPVEHPQKIKKTNLGSEINSQYSELAPIISPDGNLLFFTMGVGHPDNLGEEHLQDCYVSRKMSDGHWGAPRNLGAPINSTGNDAISGVSTDGSVLFVKNFGYNHRNGLCFARFVGRGQWKLDSITIDKYSNESQLATQCISGDGSAIIFSAQREGGVGGTDLYVSTLVDPATNHFGAPKNLGSLINTSGDEFAPFLAVDGRTLYFSSNRPGGYGDADVYVAHRLDDTWTNWSPPKNLGPEINTPGMDAYYSVPASGDVAYFSSSNGANHMDLFMVTLSDDLRPNPVVLISGKAVNQKGQPLGAAVACRDLLTDSIIATSTSNSYTGNFALIVPVGREYSVTADFPKYLPYAGHLDLTSPGVAREMSMHIMLDTAVGGAKTTLANIFFGLDSAVLKPESSFELDRLGRILHQNPTWSVTIEGFTDSTGTTDHNLELSKERAAAVVSYLSSQGIDPARLVAEGLGPNGAIASNATEQGRSQNRRVVFVLRETGN